MFQKSTMMLMFCQMNSVPKTPATRVISKTVHEARHVEAERDIPRVFMHAYNVGDVSRSFDMTLFIRRSAGQPAQDWR